MFLCVNNVHRLFYSHFAEKTNSNKKEIKLWRRQIMCRLSNHQIEKKREKKQYFLRKHVSNVSRLIIFIIIYIFILCSWHHRIYRYFSVFQYLFFADFFLLVAVVVALAKLNGNYKMLSGVNCHERMKQNNNNNNNNILK